MAIRLTLQPGQAGTKKLVDEYGDRLVCVRYRYDAEKCKRYKTVELIVEESPWAPQSNPPADDALMGLVVGKAETTLQQRTRKAGGRWNSARRMGIVLRTSCDTGIDRAIGGRKCVSTIRQPRLQQ